MLELKDLLQEGEVIANYHICSESFVRRSAITTKGNSDIQGALEDTLRRILENGISEDVYRIMGAYVPSETELDELEEVGEYTPLDLGYVLPSLIDYWKESEVKMEQFTEKANAEIKKVKDYITKNKGMFECMNLKLHDASYYEFDEMEKDFPLCYGEKDGISYFNLFCERSYDDFNDWCKEQKIDFDKMRKPLGRTSWFWLTDLVEEYRNEIDWGATMQRIIEQTCDIEFYAEIGEDGFIHEENIDYASYDFFAEDEVKEIISKDVDYIAKNLWAEFQKEIEDVAKVYEYIKKFKENQVECFKDYISGFEEVKVAEKEREEAYEKERLEIIGKMPTEIQPIMVRWVQNKDDLNVILKYIK